MQQAGVNTQELTIPCVLSALTAALAPRCAILCSGSIAPAR